MSVLFFDCFSGRSGKRGSAALAAGLGVGSSLLGVERCAHRVELGILLPSLDPQLQAVQQLLTL